MTEETASPTSSSGYAALIRGNANFRALWLAQMVSLLGDWLNFVATAALVAELSGSGLAVGALFVVRMLAPFLVSPPAGVVADRYDRKKILIATDLTRAVVVLGFLLVRDPSHVWLLYALTALQLAISGFFYPARSAILPNVVAERDIGAANAITSATWSVMLALGAALGGLVSGVFGIYPAFVIDSATFLVSAFFVLRVHLPEPGAEEAAAGVTRASGLELYREGLAYLGRHRDVLLIAMQKAMVALFISAGFQVVQVGIAQRVFPIGEAGGVSLGLMFALAGVGTGVGPIVARRWTGDRRTSLCRAILLGYAFCALGLLLTVPLWNFESILLATLLRGTGGGIIWVFSTQLLLQGVPGHVLGRVFGSEFAFFTLAGAVGATAAGWSVDTSLGLSGTTLAMAALTLVPAAVWGMWLRGGPDG